MVRGGGMKRARVGCGRRGSRGKGKEGEEEGEGEGEGEKENNGSR